MAKKVIVNIGKVKQPKQPKTVKFKIVGGQPKPKDFSSHFKFKKVTKWANKQILARFKFKKVAKWENIKLVKKSKTH